MLGAYQYIVTQLAIKAGSKDLTPDEDGFVRTSVAAALTEKAQAILASSLWGYDIDATMVRLGLMNLMMHGIDEPHIDYKDTLSKSYTEAGGTIIKKLGLPFPNVEFQALLTEIASLKPDAVACFFAGGGAAKFLRDYAAAGLNKNIQLYGSGFLTEGVLDAAGDAANGVLTTMHYSDSLDTPANKKFRLDYAKTFKLQPDVYAVQGYDTGLLLIKGANAVKGDLSNKKALYAAMEGATIDSPRGKWSMSKSHNPVQDMYLRKVDNKENKVIGIAQKAVADPGTGCRMG